MTWWLMALTPAIHANTNTPVFGFTGPEIFPIDSQISQLRSADVDGDGLKDLLVVNNARSRINVLYNQTGKTNLPADTALAKRREINELPPDARFRIDSISSEKRIASLEVADLNSDGQADIAYYGEPKELILLYGENTNNWSAPRRWPLEDGVISPNALAHGDLNGDQLTDLLLLAENHCYLLAQTTNHTLAEPERIPYTGTVKSVQILDINGDGKDDLLLVNWDSTNPFRFRLQNETGQLGPEIHFPLIPVRSYMADDLNGDHKTEIITIAQSSGLAQLATFSLKAAEPLHDEFRKGQFQVLPLNRTTKARRGLVWADINHDQRPDLIVSEPDMGVISVRLQKPNGTLSSSRSYPSLSGVSDIEAGDWDGNGKKEIFLLSADERQIGRTWLDEKERLPFPVMMPLEGRPLAMALGPLQAGSKPVLAVIIDQDGARSLAFLESGAPTRYRKLNESFKSNPTGLVCHDIDQDGLSDFIVLIPYEKMKILRQVKSQSFQEMDIAPPGGTVDQPWLSFADIDGDGRTELLLPQKNFLRAIVLRRDESAKGIESSTNWTFQVKEQINGAAINSRLVGAAALRNGTNRVASLFLLDAERKALTLCERDQAGVWQTLRNLPLPVTDFDQLQPVALGSNQANHIAFLGLNAVGWMSFSGKSWEVSHLDDYETPVKDGYLRDVIPGDLNQDGLKDLVFLETGRNHIDIVAFQPAGHLVQANRWRVFEERTFRSRRGNGQEPREAIITDLTGDGKNDLAVIVHDRILVYPQE